MSRLAKKHVDLSQDVNLSELIEDKKAKDKVQAVEPLKMYRALMSAGASDSLEVLELLSSEQVTRILDYDSWREGKLVPKKAFQWLALYADISKKALYTRFNDLEEEYQISLLSRYLKVFEPEEFEELSDEEQDALYSFPGNAIYYQILSEDPAIEKFIVELLEAIMTENMEYALSLVAHASYLPPNESEMMITQFRNARNEEDGFIPYDEAMTAFIPVNISTLTEKWSKFIPENEGLIDYKSKSNQFLMDVLAEGAQNSWSASEKEQISQSYIYLTNQLASLVGVDPGDLNELKKILEQTYSLTGFSLQVLSKGDVELASKILLKEYPKMIFRFAISMTNELRKDVLENWTEEGIEDLSQFNAYFSASKYGMCLDWIDQKLLETHGTYFSEVYKGLFNRFSLVPQHAPMSSSGLEANRISFGTLDSVEAFEKLKVEVAAALQLSKLAKLANGGVNGKLDSILTKSLASVLVGGKFINRIFDENLTKKLVELSQEDISNVLNELFGSIESMCENEQLSVKLSRTGLDKSLVAKQVALHLSTLAMDLSQAIAESQGDNVRILNYLTNV
jgi:hypothetical protein